MPETEASPVAILVALREELTALQPLLTQTQRVDVAGRRVLFGQIDTHPVILEATGMGVSRAREIALSVIKETAPRAVIATGFAGAVDPALETGDIVVGETVSDEGQVAPRRTFLGHPALLQAAANSANFDGKIVTGALATVARILDDVAAKTRFRHSNDAIAVDMESVGTARAANVYDIPLLCVRVILDDADTALPFDVDRIVGPGGGIRWLSAVTYFLTHPVLLGEVPAFHARCQLARQNLAAFVRDLVKHIPTHF